MTGQRYGKWTVLDYAGRGRQGQVRWKCRCDCGTVREVDGYSLRRGDSNSCGCIAEERWKQRDLSGQKFGRLTFIEPTDEQYVWKARCDCGTVKNVNMHLVLSGHIQSCGCLHNEIVAERNRRGRKSLTGQRFGRLVVIKNVEPDKRGVSRYLCQCDCGNQKVVGLKGLTAGTTFSCGCAKYTHGDCKRSGVDPLHIVWSSMKARCFNPNETEYKNYGGRGITVCKEWKNNYTSFREWAKSNGYKRGLEIDRIDNDGDYRPENCRWVTSKENCRNKRNNRYLTALGRTQCVSAWAEEIGITPSAVRNWDVRKGREYAEKRLTWYLTKDKPSEVEVDL